MMELINNVHSTVAALVMLVGIFGLPIYLIVDCIILDAIRTKKYQQQVVEECAKIEAQEKETREKEIEDLGILLMALDADTVDVEDPEIKRIWTKLCVYNYDNYVFAVEKNLKHLKAGSIDAARELAVNKIMAK